MIDIRQLKYGVSDAAMKVLLEEADRIIEAHRDALFYNLINLNPLMHGKIKLTDMESPEREQYRMACKHYGVEGGCRRLSKCGHDYAYDVMCSEKAQSCTQKDSE